MVGVRFSPPLLKILDVRLSPKILYLPLCAVMSMALAMPARAVPMRGGDARFDSHIHSIQLHRADNPAAEPVIELGGGEQVLLTFDDLSGSHRSFTYKIVLCNADWHESDLLFSEYIAGFQEDNIQDYRQSFNTLTPYTFFELRIPNANTDILLSGNYKIEVADSDEPQKVLFQKGFAVVERTLPFKAACSINRTALDGRGNCSQQLDLKLDYQPLNVPNPRTDIKVRITQNGYRPPVPPPEAVFVAQYGVDYSFPDKNLYAGGAEYRQFDISSFEYRTLRAHRIEVVENQYRVWLEPDGIIHQHLAYLDDNGGYLVRSARYEENSSTESDYAQVFFTLAAPRQLAGRVYVFGELTNWQLSDACQMRYNAQQTQYELALPLKQGHYDYRYVLLPEGGVPDLAAIEHCSAETENTYGIYVYYRSLADRHDRLVNVTWVKTRNS